jgi:hypothetical protein
MTNKIEIDSVGDENCENLERVEDSLDFESDMEEDNDDFEWKTL